MLKKVNPILIKFMLFCGVFLFLINFSLWPDWQASAIEITDSNLNKNSISQEYSEPFYQGLEYLRNWQDEVHDWVSGEFLPVATERPAVDRVNFAFSKSLLIFPRYIKSVSDRIRYETDVFTESLFYISEQVQNLSDKNADNIAKGINIAADQAALLSVLVKNLPDKFVGRQIPNTQYIVSPRCKVLEFQCRHPLLLSLFALFPF